MSKTELLSRNRVILCHFDDYSHALLFPRWAHGMLWPQALHALHTRLDIVGAQMLELASRYHVQQVNEQAQRGAAAVVVVLIGSTTFDGFSQGGVWTGASGLAQSIELVRHLRASAGRRVGALLCLLRTLVPRFARLPRRAWHYGL